MGFRSALSPSPPPSLLRPWPVPCLVLPLLLGGIVMPAQAGAQATQEDYGVRPERPTPDMVVPPTQYLQAVERGTRTADGAPGPNYWQQWTDYVISTRLDPGKHRITGTARITYRNNSPGALGTVFVQLLQNLHAPGAIRNRPAEVTGGVNLARVVADGQVLADSLAGDQPGYRVNGTIMALRLPRPVAPGDSTVLGFEWSFIVPRTGVGRMGWDRDDLFYIAYWYPQMAVYDDVVGWQLDPYLGNAEFYAGFGSYDVTVSVPEGWLVRATGSLQNGSAVLAPGVRERLARAEASDAIVHVVSQEDLDAGNVTRESDDGWLSWKFVADTVRDFAFSATRDSRWDAARTSVGDRDGDGQPDYTRVDAIWRATAPKWSRSAEYTRHAIDFLSRYTGLPYPWPHMTAVEGEGIIGGGMEFPMMTLIGAYNTRSDSALYYVTAHEEAHMWLPMTVSVDEKRYAWMDEGSTTFHENQARKEFFAGVDADDPDRRSYLDFARTGREGEMMRWSDYHYQGARVPASYAKPATVLVTLRRLLGEDVFHAAWRKYLRDWRFKNPKPWDYFRSMAASAGRDLDWFWYSWYYTTWQLDQAIESVAAVEGGVRVTVRDLGRVPMPVYLTITAEDGSTVERIIPVDPWLAGRRRASATAALPGPVARVEIDAAGVLPDIDRTNNVWRR